MNALPTLEEITVQLQAQDAELAETTRLAETIHAGVTIDATALRDFDDCVEPPATAGVHFPSFGIRA